MELGGKAPAIVCEDVDLAKAARGCGMCRWRPLSTRARFTCPPRNASSSTPESLRSSSRRSCLLKRTSPTPQGWDIAQLVSDVAVINNKKLITDALSKGVQLLADDKGHGIWSASELRLTIITDVRNDMDIYYKGSFGPVVSLLVVIPPSKEMI
ncbi:hypothetical protein J3E69DRAFT_189338 [Trichoderma sp. SZMC 28015]